MAVVQMGTSKEYQFMVQIYFYFNVVVSTYIRTKLFVKINFDNLIQVKYFMKSILCINSNYMLNLLCCICKL